MKLKVVRRISRPDAALVKALGEMGVATVHEAQNRSGLMRPYMRPIFPTPSLSGPAITVSAQPGDNIMIHAAIEVCQPGDVIVADMDGVVVVPREHAAEVVKAGRERIAKEKAVRERLRARELSLDFYGLREKLKELGVEYEEE